jgi:hypothetical protein
VNLATEQAPLIFFVPAPGVDALRVAQGLVTSSGQGGTSRIDATGLVWRLKGKPEFARLEINLPHFSLDDPRREVGMDGTAYETHIHVRFYGNFGDPAGRLFEAMRAEGLVCYSVWDGKFLDSWPKWQELEVDGGFGARMSRIVERESARLRGIEPDPRRRVAMLNAFVKSADFRAQMAKEGRAESKPARRGQTKTYSDYVDCYVRWKTGRPSAKELAALRKLDTRYAAMSVAALCRIIGDSPRLKLLTAVHASRAAEFLKSGARSTLLIDIEPV